MGLYPIRGIVKPVDYPTFGNYVVKGFCRVPITLPILPLSVKRFRESLGFYDQINRIVRA